MTDILNLTVLFMAKVLDNGLNTAKTILIQRNRCLLAGIAVMLSSYLYFFVVRDVVAAENNGAMIAVSVASGAGCCIAVMISNRFSREKIYINVIMSDDREAMKQLRDFLAKHHITNVATDSYTCDWSKKTITITAYAETKEQSRLINQYLVQSPLKFKRMVQKYEKGGDKHVRRK